MVAFDPGLGGDAIAINGRPAREAEAVRVSAFLDLVRKEAGLDCPAEVRTENNFPTASGLASSASGFAALAAAAARAAGLEIPPWRLAQLARMGSGSAARSVFGGFVELAAGVRPDGADCLPHELLPHDAWDIRLVIAVNGRAEKAVGSTEGMERTKNTSPYYLSWIETHAVDMDHARRAIHGKNFRRLGEVTESSCFKMHAAIMAAAPPIIYWNGTTVEAIRAVRELREKRGLEAYITIDAGPHVKVLCQARHSREIARSLAGIEGVERVMEERPGPGVEILE
jgi:diphosphomevalonate decarboxylase